MKVYGAIACGDRGGAYIVLDIRRNTDELRESLPTPWMRSAPACPHSSTSGSVCLGDLVEHGRIPWVPVPTQVSRINFPKDTAQFLPRPNVALVLVLQHEGNSVLGRE